MNGSRRHRRPGERSQSPPLGFSPFGLDGDWTGSRRLSMFGGAIGDPVPDVWLAHSCPAGGYLDVGTEPRARRDPKRPAARWEYDLAERAAHLLLNLTVPELSVPRPPGGLTALVEHMRAAATRRTEWTPTCWYIEGEPVTARVWRFAHGWAGYSTAHPDHGLMLAGVDLDPDDWSLVPIADTTAYGFELTRPLGQTLLGDIVRARAGEPDDLPRRRSTWHPDQIAALG